MIKAARRRRGHQPHSETLEERALLATITVTSLADNLDNDGETTLREAIAAAASNADANDEIVFADGLNGVIALELGELDFNQPGALTITGNGAAATTIDAQGQSDIFSVTSRDRTLRALTLANSAGHGFEADGFADDFKIHRVRIEDSVITGSGGAGFSMETYSDAGYYSSLVITDTVITGSTGRGVALEGGVGARIEDSEISENGGGVVTSFDFNGDGPELSILSSVIRDNDAGAGDGGGVRGSSSVSIFDSLVTGNRAARGAGLFEPGTLTRTTISNNVATGDGGGIYQPFGPPTNLTVSGNSAARGAGIFFNNSTQPVTNSTIVGNTASNAGGGIFFELAEPSNRIESSVISGNTATNGSHDLRIPISSQMTIRNNFIGTNQGADLPATGTTPDGDGNFIGESGAVLDAQLADPTTIGLQTIQRPLASSLLVDNGSNPSNLETDQVGVLRNANGDPDIGATEFIESGLVLTNVEVTEGNSGTTEMTFTVQSTVASDPFTVDVATADGTATAGSDYQAVTDTLSFSGAASE